MLFALLKKLQNYAIFMLKVIILCRIMLTYAANVLCIMMVLCKIAGEYFCRGRCTVVVEVQWGQRTVRPSYDRR